MERILMICSNCSVELGFIETEVVDSGFYSKYMCGNCKANLVPDLESPIIDIGEPLPEEPLPEEPLPEEPLP